MYYLSPFYCPALAGGTLHSCPMKHLHHVTVSSCEALSWPEIVLSVGCGSLANLFSALAAHASHHVKHSPAPHNPAALSGTGQLISHWCWRTRQMTST